MKFTTQRTSQLFSLGHVATSPPFMIKIEVMIQEDNEFPSDAHAKVWELEVPAMPRRGDLFLLLQDRSLTLPQYVREVCFVDRGGSCCIQILVGAHPPT